MTKKAGSLLLLLLIAASCRTQKPDLGPPTGAHFRSISVKFSFQDETSRQNGKALWRFDDQCSKFIFFTPLNQVGLELDVAGEEAVLVNFSKKSFWRGDFSRLLDRLWGIGLPLAELKQLLAEGKIPEPGFAEQGVEAFIERAQAAGEPRSVRLRRGGSELTLRIYKNEVRPGRVVLVDYAQLYQAHDLERVLEND